jgi:hypothetical protein
VKPKPAIGEILVWANFNGLAAEFGNTPAPCLKPFTQTP